MLLTEKEARAQVCPFIRCTINLAETKGGAFPMYVHLNCQASECKMAWRWSSDTNRAQAVGYCGMAGKPEVA